MSRLRFAFLTFIFVVFGFFQTGIASPPTGCSNPRWAWNDFYAWGWACDPVSPAAPSACAPSNENVDWVGGQDQVECSPNLCKYTCSCCTMCCMATNFDNDRMSPPYFASYRKYFIMDAFYKCPVESSLKQLSDELRNAQMFRVMPMGALIDASVLNHTLKELQIFTTESLKSYAPSEQICRFGTLSRALAGSEAKVNTDRLVLSEIGLAKNLGKVNTISAAGLGAEFDNRLRIFALKYCDLQDNFTGLSGLCPTAQGTQSKDLNLNRDIDYTRLMDNNATISADLTDANNTQDETNLITLSHFLYGHRQPIKRISLTSFNESPGSLNLYSEYRSVAARRAAAQNSYNTLVAMRMAGSGASNDYMRDMLVNMGVPTTDIDSYLKGKTTDSASVNSSYNAQMNLLTKQIFQNPAFYANLMESKENVKRTSASMQGLGLMQSRDTYKSMARSEMLLSILVELEARKISNNIQGMGN